MGCYHIPFQFPVSTLTVSPSLPLPPPSLSLSLSLSLSPSPPNPIQAIKGAKEKAFNQISKTLLPFIMHTHTFTTQCTCTCILHVYLMWVHQSNWFKSLLHISISPPTLPSHTCSSLIRIPFHCNYRSDTWPMLASNVQLAQNHRVGRHRYV